MTINFDIKKPNEIVNDFDGDGILNAVDLDDDNDNDGILDTEDTQLFSIVGRNSYVAPECEGAYNAGGGAYPPDYQPPASYYTDTFFYNGEVLSVSGGVWANGVVYGALPEEMDIPTSKETAIEAYDGYKYWIDTSVVLGSGQSGMGVNVNGMNIYIMNTFLGVCRLPV